MGFRKRAGTTGSTRKYYFSQSRGRNDRRQGTAPIFDNMSTTRITRFYLPKFRRKLKGLKPDNPLDIEYLKVQIARCVKEVKRREEFKKK